MRTRRTKIRRLADFDFSKSYRIPLKEKLRRLLIHRIPIHAVPESVVLPVRLCLGIHIPRVEVRVLKNEVLILPFRPCTD